MSKVNNLWVVDDDEIYRFAIKIIINRAEIAEQTYYFNNGQVAIDAFRENMLDPEQLPDLILLDLNMPILDGWQFLEAFNGLSPAVSKKIKIYLVTSSNDEEDYNRARSNSSVDDLIVKPLTINALRDITARRAME
jgi:CheY-like chemotaxis protein